MQTLYRVATVRRPHRLQILGPASRSTVVTHYPVVYVKTLTFSNTCLNRVTGVGLANPVCIKWVLLRIPWSYFFFLVFKGNTSDINTQNLVDFKYPKEGEKYQTVPKH